MKTKILSLALALLMVVSSLVFVSCEEPKTTYEIVTQAIESTLALDTMRLSIDENVKQKVDGVSKTQKTGIAAVFKGFNSDSPEYSTDLEIESSGVTVEMGLYFKDGYFYLDALGNKTRVKEGKDTDSYNVHDLVKTILRQIPEDQFEGKTLDEGKIEFELTPEVFEANFEEFIDRSIAAMEAVGKITSKTFRDCKVGIEIKDGYVENYSISYKLNLKVKIGSESYSVDVNVTDDLKIIDPGKEAKVIVPSDIDDYDGL